MAVGTSIESTSFTLESVLRNCIGKLLKLVGSKKLKDLRTECQNTLDYLNQLKSTPQEEGLPNVKADTALPHSNPVSKNDSNSTTDETLSNDATHEPDGDTDQSCSSSDQILKVFDANILFNPFQMACACKVPKVVQTALDAIQMLFAFGIFMDETDKPSVAEKNRVLTDSIIQSVCRCFSIADESTSIQVMRCLLTAITSQQCRVHGHSLQLAVSTLFRIFEESRDSQCQYTAQASLIQIVNVVMSRAEISVHDRVPTGKKLDNLNLDVRCSKDLPATQTTDQDVVKSLEENESRKQISIPPTVELAEENVSYSFVLESWIKSYLNQFVDKFVEMECENKEGSEKQKAINESGEISGKFGFCTVCRKPAQHYCLDTEDPVCSKPCKETNLLNLFVLSHCPFTHPYESNISLIEQSNKLKLSQDSTVSQAAVCYMSQGQKDALMLLNLMCKLSMADIPSTVPNTPWIARTKRLSLELILNMLQSCGPILKSSERLIKIIKNSLCIVLVKNSVSHIPVIFGLSLNIFLMLIRSFKDNLRSEVGVFVDQILVRILESGNSTFEHKERVLQVLLELCADTELSIELFLNFDCQVEEKDVYTSMIDCLSRVSQGKYTSVDFGATILPQQRLVLRRMAICCLVKLIAGIRNWVSKVEPQRLEDSVAKLPKEDSETSEMSVEKLPDLDEEEVLAIHGSSEVYQQRLRKSNLQLGIYKFNLKTEKGIEYLVKMGHVENTPEAISKLLMTQDGFNKTQLGRYLGCDNEFNKRVLHCFVDLISFSRITIDQALKKFVQYFRLPGESQMIDRMMEKFAEKYHLDNPGVFKNADCPYVLAFSLIMLHTDAHSKEIKPERKMSKEQFIRNNRGIYDGEDLSRDFLSMLYDNVVNEEWIMDDDQLKKKEDEIQQDDSIAAALNMSNAGRKKFELFLRESEGIINKTTEMIKKKVNLVRPYRVASGISHIHFMLESTFWPLLASFSVILEMSDDSEFINFCIDGMEHCIRLAASLGMATHRESFVSSLAKFTHLATIKEIKPKNIRCIQLLFSIAATEGDRLESSWLPVLQCISQLDRLHLIQSNVNQDAIFSQSTYKSETVSNKFNVSQPDVVLPNKEKGDHGSMTLKKRTSASFSSIRTKGLSQSSSGFAILGYAADAISNPWITNSESASSAANAFRKGALSMFTSGLEKHLVEQSRSEYVMSQIDSSQIDLLFDRSINLSSTAIIHFVTYLCQVSRDELLNTNSPRIFSLQKLVEVAGYNMDRIRLVWSRIWSILRCHFAEVALHPYSGVRIYAMDSMRQLAMKFLAKDELAQFNFQLEFLKPFLAVMTHPNTCDDMKEFIVETVYNMSQTCSTCIKSGWKIVLEIIAVAASMDSGNVNRRAASLLGTAFFTLNQLLDRDFTVVAEQFWIVTECLRAFAMNVSCPQGVRPIQIIEKIMMNVIKNDLYHHIDNSAACRYFRETAEDVQNLLDRWAKCGAHRKIFFLRSLIFLTDLASNIPSSRECLSALNLVFKMLDDECLHGPNWLIMFQVAIDPMFKYLLSLERAHAYGDAEDETWKKLKTRRQWNLQMNSANVEVFPKDVVTWLSIQSILWFLQDHPDHIELLLPPSLNICVACIKSPSETTARYGIEVIQDISYHFRNSLTSVSWKAVYSALQNALHESIPYALMLSMDELQSNVESSSTLSRCNSKLDITDDSSAAIENEEGATENASQAASNVLPFNTYEVTKKCIVQLLIIDLMQGILLQHASCAPLDTVMDVIESLRKSYTFAYEFNQNINLRLQLKSMGFMREMKQLPGLLKQERDALAAFLSIIVAVLTHHRDTLKFCKAYVHMPSSNKTETSPELPQEDQSNLKVPAPLTDNTVTVTKIRDLAEISSDGNASQFSSSSVPSSPSASSEDSKSLENLSNQFFSVSWMIARRYIEREQKLLVRAKNAMANAQEMSHSYNQFIQIEAEREVDNLASVVNQSFLRGLFKMPDVVLRLNRAPIFSILVELVLVESRDIRLLISRFLSDRYSKLLDFDQENSLSPCQIGSTQRTVSE